MTTAASISRAEPRRLLHSAGAILLGLVAVAGLSLATDQLFHVLEVYPPWGQPMHEPSLNVLALSYRIVYAVVGGYVAARFAPSDPMRHAVVLGVIGVILSLIGVLATLPLNLGPAWYPVSLVFIALPGSWLGGALYRGRRVSR
jgi:hypothetical protein